MRKSLIFILILISISGVRAAYTVDSALCFADYQYTRGNYTLALKEYQRVSFHTGFEDAFLQFRIGNCYLQLGNWQAAQNYYDQVFQLTSHDSLLVEAKIQKISSLIREESYKKALIDLYGIPDSVYRNYGAEINLLFAITHFGLEEFDTSRDYFKRLVPDDSGAQHRIDSLFSRKKYLHRPNPGVAYALSLVIPGLGQMYSGSYGEGLNSFFLNEALLLLGVFVLYEYTWVDALVTVLPWYQRYYMGGLDNAREAAIRQRQKRRSVIYKSAIDVVRESDQ